MSSFARARAAAGAVASAAGRPVRPGCSRALDCASVGGGVRRPGRPQGLAPRRAVQARPRGRRAVSTSSWDGASPGGSGGDGVRWSRRPAAVPLRVRPRGDPPGPRPNAPQGSPPGPARTYRLCRPAPHHIGPANAPAVWSHAWRARRAPGRRPRSSAAADLGGGMIALAARPLVSSAALAGRRRRPPLLPPSPRHPRAARASPDGRPLRLLPPHVGTSAAVGPSQFPRRACTSASRPPPRRLRRPPRRAP